MPDLYPAVLTITQAAPHEDPGTSGEVDLNAMRQYLDWICGPRNSDGLFALGTTGLGPILPWPQHQEVLHLIRDVSKIPVVVMVGPPLPSAPLLEKLAWLHAHHLEAVALLPPLYYDFPAEAQVETLTAAARSWRGAVWLYNIPQRVGYALSHDTVARVVERCPNVVGIKDSSGDGGNIPVWRQIFGQGRVFCGAEPVALPSLLAGADGLVSQYASVLPEVGRALATDQRAGRKQLQASLNRLIQRSAHLPLISLLGELGFRRGILPRPALPPWPALEDSARPLVHEWLALGQIVNAR